MIFRWSGAVAYDDQQAKERLRHYFETIGYRCVQHEPELMMRRGSLWHGFVSASPRRILTGVVARTQPWGAQTLVDVEFYIFQRGRSWHELDAELLVEETREMIRHLQEGNADFERLNQIDRNAVRHAWRAMFTTLTLITTLMFLVGFILTVLRTPHAFSAVSGVVIGGLVAAFLVLWLTHRRR